MSLDESSLCVLDHITRPWLRVVLGLRQTRFRNVLGSQLPIPCSYQTCILASQGVFLAVSLCYLRYLCSVISVVSAVSL